MEAANKSQIDVYDEEFFNNLQLAKKLVEQIRTRRDKEICKKWIGKLLGLKSDDPVVKKNRNSFFKYMLQILLKGAQEDGLQFDSGAPGQQKKRRQDDDLEYMSKWSGDNRTYIAAKPLPGQGTLIYMAVSSDPSLGWDHP